MREPTDRETRIGRRQNEAHLLIKESLQELRDRFKDKTYIDALSYKILCKLASRGYIDYITDSPLDGTKK